MWQIEGVKDMKQRLAIPLLAGLVCVAGTAFATDFPEVQRRGTLRVLAVHEDLFFSLKPGTLPGFDRELLEGFANLHKIKLEVVALESWDAMIPSLLEGKGDLIVGGYAITDARRKQIEFTTEVFPSRKLVFTRKPHRVVKTLEELRAEKVGTVKGTSMAEAVRNAGVPESNVEYVPSGTLPAALRAGKITAAVLGVEHAIVEQRNDPDVQLGLFLGTPGSLAYGLRKEDLGLKKALDEYIDNFRKSPSWSRLVVKYLGESAPEILKKARAE
jgi:ABC-type amino acid transport substrate-binding protein